MKIDSQKELKTEFYFIFYVMSLMCLNLKNNNKMK